jgi:2-polyprenyl-3-methyl-5-hydroxy-6-metoxy-1,4-benzoquinol methylase
MPVSERKPDRLPMGARTSLIGHFVEYIASGCEISSSEVENRKTRRRNDFCISPSRHFRYVDQAGRQRASGGTIRQGARYRRGRRQQFPGSEGVRMSQSQTDPATVVTPVASQARSAEGQVRELPFDYESIPLGYYDQVMHEGHPIRRCWHRQKFQRVLDTLPKDRTESVLDIGCFCGTFLSLIRNDRFRRQVGVDILPRQIDWANEHYGTPFREFRKISSLKAIGDIDETFDCVTLIEVIEHLQRDDIRDLLDAVSKVLKPGGSFVLTTPNYASLWPILEIILNRRSDVKYEEQHVTKFKFGTFEKTLEGISGNFDRSMTLDLKTTSHFILPFLGIVSTKLANRAARYRDPSRWRFPYGALILARFRKSN